jgi:hypothetical protein
VGPIACLAAGSAFADDLELGLGRLKYDSYGSTQVVSVLNRGKEAISLIFVECGFYVGEELVGASPGMIQNLAPGAQGYEEISIADFKATRSACRIVRSQ